MMSTMSTFRPSRLELLCAAILHPTIKNVYAGRLCESAHSALLFNLVRRASDLAIISCISIAPSHIKTLLSPPLRDACSDAVHRDVLEMSRAFSRP